MSGQASSPIAAAPVISEGRCYIYFAFDLGLSINLEICDKLISEPRQDTRLRHKQKTPKYFDYNPPPLRINQRVGEFCFTEFDYCTRDNVDVTIFDFGAVSVCYKIDLHGPLERLIGLSEALYENELLYEDATRRAAHVFKELAPAITKPNLSELCENYQVFDIVSFESPVRFDEFLAQHGQLVGQILRSDRAPFSQEQIQDALSCNVSYSPDDISVIDWNSALLFGGDSVDVRAVLEFANIELLEMRYQDNELDEALESAYQSLTSGKQLGSDSRRIAQLQVDSAMMYEGVNNALKLLGDQYLARVYSLVSKRFHLQEWDSSIFRKLETLNSIYTKMADQVAHRRSIALELIIVGLIAFEIVMSFVRGH